MTLTKTKESQRQQRHDDQIQPDTVKISRDGSSDRILLPAHAHFRFARLSSSGVQSRVTLMASSSWVGGGNWST